MTEYFPKLAARPYQTEALLKMRDRPAFALLMAMRTGKSKVLLDNFGELELAGKVQDLLIEAPGGVYRTWQKQISEHCSEDLLSRSLVLCWESTASKRHLADRERLLVHPGPRILLINCEALSRPGAARDFAIEFLKAPDRRSMMGIDECFVVGTKILTPSGESSIENLNVGDFVLTPNGQTKIKRVIRKRTKSFVVLTVTSGQKIKVTPTHRIFTDIGWVRADETLGRIVFDRKTAKKLLGQTRNAQMSNLQKALRRFIQTKEAFLRHVLLSEMENEYPGNTRFSSFSGKYKEARLQRDKKWKTQRAPRAKQGQANERSFAKEAFSFVKKNWAYVQSPWWQWHGITALPEAPVNKTRASMAGGIRNFIRRTTAKLSYLLQSGYRESKEETCNRVRWSKPSIVRQARTGQEERRKISHLRVESITIEECKSFIPVFDLELEGTPHFFAEGILVHNCTLNKNPAAKRTKFNNARLAPLADYRRILSGLPTPRSPLDLFSQFEFLDWNILGFRSYYTFRQRYAILAPMNFGGRIVQVVTGYRHEEELRSLIEPYSYRVEFRPQIPSTYSIREVALTPEQRRIYDELKAFATAKLSADSHVTATVVIAQLLRLHQVLCGHTTDENGNHVVIPENRTAELLELLDDYAGKAIIWCSYDHDVRKVAAALTKEYGEGSVARFWGGNLTTREDEEFLFKNSSSCRFMVSTPDAGRYGRTWDNADLVVFYSSRNDLDHREQAEQRPLGVDKRRQVDYVDLVAPGTVETKILEALRSKMNMAATINGDNWREWLI